METAKLFFELLRYSLKKDKLSSEVQKGISNEQLSSLFGLSKNHDFAHLIASALIENGLINKENPLHDKFVYEQSLAVFRYENINYELEFLCNLLENNQVEYVLLKGSVIRYLYPEPWMRTSCDIDILVHSEDTEKASKLLIEKHEYKLEREYDYEVALISPRNVSVEIHTTLESKKNKDAVNNVVKTVWDRTSVKQGYTYQKVLSDEMFYFYQVAHMARHMAYSGCGVRPYIDLYLIDKHDSTNEQKRIELLERGGLDKFIKVARLLTSVWLDGKEHDELSKQVEDFILHAGIYGSTENVILSRQNRAGGKFGYAMSRIFLKHKFLARQFPILNKHKWLNPFCQIARWFKIIFGGGVKRSVNELKEIKNRPTDQVEQRENMMRELGLWK